MNLGGWLMLLFGVCLLYGGLIVCLYIASGSKTRFVPDDDDGDELESGTKAEGTDHVGKVCPFCQAPIKPDVLIVVCPSCNQPHHKECWDENRGCTSYGCPERTRSAEE